MAGTRNFPLAILILLFTFSQFHGSTPSKLEGLSLRLVPRDSPESPLYPGNLTLLERIERMINFTNARAHRLESASKIGPESISFRLTRDDYYYTVQVALGIPDVIVYLLVDSGGGLIWTQCLPCKNCYRQDPRFPIYSSVQSQSYQKLPCDSPLCDGSPGALYQCVNDECVYNVGYGGGGSTKGVASQETFKFIFDAGPGRPKGVTSIVNIVFGCSNDNQNIQFGKNGVISGVLGLNRAPDSLVSQLFSVTQKKFSYCFVPFSQALPAPSALRFGQDVPNPGGVRTTPFLTPPGSPYYHLDLLDISVGRKLIGFAPGSFAVKPDGTGGFIVDSGALITKIDQGTIDVNAYRKVMHVFQKYYDRFSQLERMRGRVVQGFQLCYRHPRDFQDYIGLTYHFQGADYVVDKSFVHFYDEQGGYFCVALLPGSGKSILGAWHQQNMRLTYDLNINALQFITEDCSRDIF